MGNLFSFEFFSNFLLSFGRVYCHKVSRLKVAQCKVMTDSKPIRLTYHILVDPRVRQQTTVDFDDVRPAE